MSRVLLTGTITATQMPRPLIGQVFLLKIKYQSTGGTNGNTGGAVVAFLTEIIAHRVKPKLAYRITFFTIITICSNAFYA